MIASSRTMTTAAPEVIAIGETVAIGEARGVETIPTETDLTELTVLIKWSEGIIPNDWSVEIALIDRTIPAVGEIDQVEILPPARFNITQLKAINLAQVISLILVDACNLDRRIRHRIVIAEAHLFPCHGLGCPYDLNDAR